ncbi:MAG: Sensor protein ZraS [Verrucomicrobia subdivision 3 bacterium]|nr:Sensor protein ZraS [Limisphaerales bacterium]MCS1413219.1 Sensor protein ZraS [Limisphaerales bacterium]
MSIGAGAASGTESRTLAKGFLRPFRCGIFDPFFTAKKPGEGSGMGLSVALGIIEQHEGGIEIESTEGLGSLFTVYLSV